MNPECFEQLTDGYEEAIDSVSDLTEALSAGYIDRFSIRTAWRYPGFNSYVKEMSEDSPTTPLKTEKFPC